MLSFSFPTPFVLVKTNRHHKNLQSKLSTNQSLGRQTRNRKNVGVRGKVSQKSFEVKVTLHREYNANNSN